MFAEFVGKMNLNAEQICNKDAIHYIKAAFQYIEPLDLYFNATIKN